MNAKTKALVDPREAAQILQELQRNRPGFVPEWLPAPKSMDEALLRIFVRYIETIRQRLNQAPDKNFMAFLETFGVRQLPAQSARAPIVFQVAELAEDGRIPQGTKLGAAPPPGQNDQIIFETEKTVGLASAKLVQVVSLNPGRDEFKDHTEALLKGEPFTIFSGMQRTEHVLYLAHQRLLALVGKTSLRVFFDLQTGSAERLDLTWEYWDGKVWRAFKNVLEQCDEPFDVDMDSTDGLTRSGRFVLETDCAETQKKTINGVESYWIRARLLEPLPMDPAQALPLVDTVKMQTVVSREILTVLNEDVTVEVIVDMQHYPDPKNPSKLSFFLRGSQSGPLYPATITWSLFDENNQIPRLPIVYSNLEINTGPDGKTTTTELPPAIIPKITDIEVSPPYFDFDYEFETLAVGETYFKDFTLKNTGQATLERIRLSLPSAVPDEWLLSQREIADLSPDASISVRVTFAPKTPGRKEAKLIIASNDPDENPLEIELRATAKAPLLVVLPDEPQDFGAVEVNTSTTKSFIAHNLGDAKLQLTEKPSITGITTEFRIDPDDEIAFALEPGESRAIRITFSPEDKGETTATLTIRSKNLELTRTLTGIGIPAVPQDIVIDPAESLSLDFDEEQKDTTSDLVFDVGNAGKQTLNIKSAQFSKVVEDDPDWNPNEFTLIPPSPARFPFNLDPEDTPQAFKVQFARTSLGLKRMRLRISSDDPDTPGLDLMLRGIASPEGPSNVSINPVALDFGYALINETMVEQEITITNNNEDDSSPLDGILTIVGIDGEGSEINTNDFNFDAGADTYELKLLGGRSETFKIEFIPQALGVRNAKLKFTATESNQTTKATKAKTSKSKKNSTQKTPKASAASPEDWALLFGFGVESLAPLITAIPAAHTFGPLRVGEESPSKVFVLRNDGSSEFAGVFDVSDLHHFEVTNINPENPFPLQPNALFTVEISVKSDTTEVAEERLFIRSQSIGQDDIAISLRSSAMPSEPAPGIVVVPSELNFGNVALNPSDPPELQSEIWNVGNAQLTGNVAAPAGNDAKQFILREGNGDFAIDQSGTKIVKVAFMPSTPPSPKSASLAIQNTNDPPLPEISISLKGNGVEEPTPKIVVTPGLHNFGSVAPSFSEQPGNEAKRTFVIRNDGGADLIVTGAEIVDFDNADTTEFVWNVSPALPVTLEPGKFISVAVSFQPASSSSNPKKANLKITSNDLSRSEINIPLEGIGQVAKPRAWRVVLSASYSIYEILFDPVDFIEEEHVQEKRFERTAPTGKTKNFTPDKGFANTEEVDLKTVFYPFGLFVLPGSAFYFSSEEVFSKPGAKVTIRVTLAFTPSQAGSNNGVDVIPHDVIWEYWNGREWTALNAKFGAAGNDKEIQSLNQDGFVEFTVPQDFKKLELNNTEAFWMRVRVLSGAFGIRRKVTYTVQPPGGSLTTNELFITEQNPPVIGEFALGYKYESPREFFDHCFALNDFQHIDYSEAARLPGQFWLPFQRLNDNLPAVYIGFDKKLPVDFLQIFCHLETLPDQDEDGPELIWEYWDGGQWRETQIEDETGRLQRPGMISFIGPNEAKSLARFGMPRYWLRGRCREDSQPQPSKFLGIFHNAVWASQRQKIQNEIIGTSRGLAHEAFAVRHFPILPDEIVEVQELVEPIAHIEYPILQEKIAAEDLRVVRNATGRVTEVWVRWQYQPHFFASGPEARHYTLNRATGRLFFGDGEHGKIPPLGAAIMLREYHTGGGTVGNVKQNAIAQLLGGVPGVEGVFNPLAGEGGAESEAPENIMGRGPLTLRQRDRALTVGDYENMAREASSEVAWVRVFQATDASLSPRPGHVTIMILPESLVSRPQPSFGLRQRVKVYLQNRALANLASAPAIHVRGPEYFEVGVSATIAPIIASEAGIVIERARAAVAEFLHPLHGGPAGAGWTLGRDVFLSDLAAVLERLPGVDYVEELSLLRDKIPQGTRLAVPDDRLVAAGEFILQAKISE